MLKQRPEGEREKATGTLECSRQRERDEGRFSSGQAWDT